MRHFLILSLLACSLPVNAVSTTVEFHYNPDEGKVPKCNGQTKEQKSPFECTFNNQGVLVVSLDSWGWEGTAILALKGEATVPTITGFCTKSVIGNFPSYNLAPACDGEDAAPPPATGDVLVDEWYTDLPWHQKLSTLDSNLIDVPFVLPYDALSKDYQNICTAAGEDEARCMLRFGILNVMGIHRTDKVYQYGEALTPNGCQGDRPCVELKLNIQRFHTQTNDPMGYEADVIGNNKVWYDLNKGIVYHQEPPKPPGDQPYPPSIPSLGFAVTEATIFAPWRNWYTGHYCAKETDSIVTSVCYDDYFTTGLIAPAAGLSNWLRDRPALFWPHGQNAFQTFCEKGNTACPMYLGKVDWEETATKPEVTERDCRNPPLIGTQLEPSVCEEQIREDTEYLDLWFNAALTEFEDVGRYPWNELPLPGPVYGLSTGDEEYNPFIGFYRLENSEENATGEKVPFNTKYKFKSPRYVLPKQCTQEDYRLARQGDVSYIRRLSDCAVNFEIHTSGFHAIWKYLYDPFADKDQPLSDDAILDITRAIRGLDANQYGRTMFLFAGVPEQHVAVSFDLLDEIRDSEDDDKVLVDAMSIYDKVYGGSIYIQYLPMVNPADRTLHWKNENDPGKNYKDDFWHAFLMSNHMNQDPDHFIRGIRGRTLWHNEYRSNKLYQSEELGHNDHTEFENILGHIDFPAGFQTDRAGLAPFHGNTCDSCHVRNGSGIPLMPNGKLPQIHVNGGMKADYHVKTSDYTYTNRTFANQEVPSMKMVFFDLVGPSETNRNECDDDNHTVPNEIDLVPIRPARRADELYSNKIMNFYGNSLQLNQNGGKLLYDMKYVDISDGDGFEIVDKTLRGPIVGDNENATYQPKRVEIDASGITESEVCSAVRARPPGVAGESWPSDCEEVSGDAINKAIADGEIGFMHLLGRRLGNTPLIEMIPDKMIRQTRREQLENSVPGCISLAPGTRSGKDGEYNYRSCSSGRFGDGRDDCYIGRWGWIGDRASLEDQIANAAHVEMNISSKESYQDLHPLPDSEDELVRYSGTLCGPANAGCRPLSAANSDITEQEIRDMATYQRWIGIPNRSEYQVASEKVQQGERIFNELQCSSCHVTKKIAFRYDDNMLPDEERDHLRRLEIPAGSEKPAEDSEPDLDYPFVSYLGTDLLMHDMGYLSQIARAPMDKELRWDNGRVKPEYRNYVQYIRTPALKGLRFNRFVTDSNHNTKDAKEEVLENNFAPGCDFLLHDGRACDAIEAAYLHDGPAVNRLKMIEKMNALSADELDQLRAFLYSL